MSRSDRTDVQERYWLCCGSKDPAAHHKQNCRMVLSPEFVRFGTAEEHREACGHASMIGVAHVGEECPPAASILKAGLRHMEDRAKTCDNPQGERSMARTVEAFNAVTGARLTEEQGWLFMVLLKTVRSQQGAYKADNYEDGAAYFGLMGEAASGRARELEGGQ